MLFVGPPIATNGFLFVSERLYNGFGIRVQQSIAGVGVNVMVAMRYCSLVHRCEQAEARAEQPEELALPKATAQAPAHLKCVAVSANNLIH